MVYLDTNILIYLLESNEYFGESVEYELTRLKDDLGLSFITSALTISELLAGRKDATPEMLRAIQGLLPPVAVDEEIAIKSGYLRRKHNIRLGGAIHLATAINTDCKLFFTNDKSLGKVAAYYTEVLRPSLLQ